MKSFTAGPNENGVRLSRFVEGVTKDMPRSMMYKAFRNKRIKVNGKRAEPDTRLSAGDLIELYINDEFFPVGKPTAKTAKLPRRQPPVTVVYEDENFAVLYKPAHLLCHSDRTGDANLVDAFAAYLEAKGEYDPHAEKRFAPALCNRIDRNTGGIVIAAKSAEALRIINEKKTLSRCGKAEYRVYLTKAVRFIFEKGYLQIRKPVYFSPFLNLEDDGEECREWEKLDNLPEEWEEAYDVNTETEILAYKK